MALIVGVTDGCRSHRRLDAGGDCTEVTFRCDDAGMARATRLLLTVVVLIGLPVVGLTACSSAAKSAAPAVQSATPVTNDLIPVDRNLEDCVGLLPRPNCGAERKADAHMYLAFAVLMLGMAFIGWRIVVGVRKRDREAQPPTSTF